jgi:RNA polymerase sigma-70 factor (family 1)
MFAGKENNENLNLQLFEGNERAFEKIFDSFWRQLFYKANSILQDEDEAKDAVQTVFTDLWRRREEKVILNLKSYLFNAVKYQVFKKLRDNKITQSHIDRFEEITSFDNIDDMIHYNEINENLNAAINRLPDKCKEVFILSRFEELSNKEISEKLNISIKTVENHITKALRNLRSDLEGII